MAVGENGQQSSAESLPLGAGTTEEILRPLHEAIARIPQSENKSDLKTAGVALHSVLKGSARTLWKMNGALYEYLIQRSDKAELDPRDKALHKTVLDSGLKDHNAIARDYVSGIADLASKSHPDIASICNHCLEELGNESNLISNIAAGMLKTAKENRR